MMLKPVLLMLACTLAGCATGPSVKSNDIRVKAYIVRLQATYPTIKHVRAAVGNDVPGGVAASKGSSDCDLLIDETYLAKGVPDAELAFVLAHELAHCAGNHIAGRRMVQDKSRYWEQEYAADRMALEATRKAGLGNVLALNSDERPFFLKPAFPDSNTHPGGAKRVDSLTGVSINGMGMFMRDGKVVIEKTRI